MTFPGSSGNVDANEAARRIRDDPDRPMLLDVRERHEFVQVRAPGAALLPISTFAARVHELPADRPLLVICHTGNRSGAVASYLARSGRKGVFNVVGGMDAWERAGLPVVRGPLEAGEGDLPTG